MNPLLLVGAGVLLGAAGPKAVKSDKAHKLYVKTAVAGLRVKDGCETIIDEAKAGFDDVLAEAGYDKETEEAEIEEEKPAAKTAAKKAPAKKAPAARTRARRGAAK